MALHNMFKPLLLLRLLTLLSTAFEGDCLRDSCELYP